MPIRDGRYVAITTALFSGCTLILPAYGQGVTNQPQSNSGMGMHLGD